MSFIDIIYTILIGPLRLFFEVVFSCAYQIIGNPGLTIIVLSLAINFLILPLYMRADALQKEENDIEAKLAPGVAHIKKTFKGDERMLILQTFYRQNNYKPTYVLRSATSLLLEIPFFMAAYSFLSHLPLLSNVSFGPIKDLGSQDGMIVIGAVAINLLPLVMTALNCISTAIFTKGYPAKTKIQLYGMAFLFLVLLYKSPAGLVFYWTLNNLFSLVKTVFYKLKNPGKVLKIMASIAGLCLVVLGIRYGGVSLLRLAAFVLCGLLLQIPWILDILKKKNIKLLEVTAAPDQKLFIYSALLLTAIVGLYIPSNVIKASPQEFFDIFSFYNPAWYIVYALCLAVGLFIVWFVVFYRLAQDKIRSILDLALTAIAICGIVNCFFFAKKLGLISPALQYDNGMVFGKKEMLLNIVVCCIILAACYIGIEKKKSLVRFIIGIMAFTVFVMSCVNIMNIEKSVDQITSNTNINNEKASFSLSKTGKNVVVIMLDRAQGDYVPYIFSEKPELLDKFSGFTYYENTISYGAHTNIAVPALYGGYEYTPEELNKRNWDPMQVKNDEALKVMPTLFYEHGYKVTVCDPTYAGYQTIPDTTIYHNFPGLNTYVTKGAFSDPTITKQKIDTKSRNFFCYAITKIAPLLLQGTIYEEGNYHNLDVINYESQSWWYKYQANGLDSGFIDAYAVLDNMPEMTMISEDGEDTFLMMSNDTAHEPMILQKPDYTISPHVDNREIGDENRLANSLFKDFEDKELHVEDDLQASGYHAQMAAFLKFGEWFDYLKEEGVYDNTRIIIVADHGFGIWQMPEITLGGAVDLEYFLPMLMVKDFGDTEFTVSDEFMTNADTPMLASEGIIENACNPYTGRELKENKKDDDMQYIFGSDDYDINTNNGNTLKEGVWYSLKGKDAWETSNWGVIKENGVLPY